jgi:hypothetical protein
MSMYWKHPTPFRWELHVDGSRFTYKGLILRGHSKRIRGRGRKWWRSGIGARKTNYWAYFASESDEPGYPWDHTTFRSFAKAKQYIETLTRLDT